MVARRPTRAAVRRRRCSASSTRRLLGLADVAEGDVLVDLRFLREAEDALADDVALDLVGAAADRGEVGVELAVVVGRLAGELLALQRGRHAEDDAFEVAGEVE